MSVKTKVLFTRPSLGYGGADRVTVNLLNAMDESKFDISLAVMHTSGELQNELKTNINVINLKVSWLGFSVKPLVQLFKSQKYDAIFSTCGGMSIPTVIAAKWAGVNAKVIVSERNSLNRTYSSFVKKWTLLTLKKLAYRRADIVSVVSDAIGQEVARELGIPKERVKRVYNPLIDDLFFEKLNQPLDLIKKDGVVYLLAVGRFVEQKDYPTLLNAVAKLNDLGKVKLWILGKGPLEEDIKERANRLDLKNVVEFLGFDANPYKYMREADVFVLSSLHEGMPGVLIQAMAAGLPVISTDCPTGPSELIISDKNGVLVPTADSTALAAAMNELVSCKDKRQLLGQAASQSIDSYLVKNATLSYTTLLERV